MFFIASHIILEKIYPKFTYQLLIGIVLYVIFFALIHDYIKDKTSLMIITGFILIDFALLLYRFKNTESKTEIKQEEPDDNYSISLNSESIKPPTENSEEKN